jgi:hypothetical protein
VLLIVGHIDYFTDRIEVSLSGFKKLEATTSEVREETLFGDLHFEVIGGDLSFGELVGSFGGDGDNF